MEKTVWTKKITRNLVEIKDRVSLALDIVVDYLIQYDAVPFNIKKELDGLPLPSAKIDHLIHCLILNGQSACGTFVECLEKNGLGDVATKIKETNVSDGNGDNVEKDDEWLESVMTNLSINSDDGNKNDDQNAPAPVITRQSTVEERLTRLENIIETEQAQTARDRQESEQLRKEKEEVSKGIERLQRQLNRAEGRNEDMQFENKRLNVKFQALFEDFSNFKHVTTQENAERNRLLEQLKRKNRLLLQEVEIMKRRVETREKENEELEQENKKLKIKLEEKKMALQLMVSSLNNTEDGKRIIKQVKRKSNMVKLPPIPKSGKK